ISHRGGWGVAMRGCPGQKRIPGVCWTGTGRLEAAIFLPAIFPGRADAWLAHSVRYGEANAPRNAPQGGIKRLRKEGFFTTPSIRRPISRRRDPADSGFQVPAPSTRGLVSATISKLPVTRCCFMSASHIAVSGTTFDCAASPYLWRHGHGVQIDIISSGKHVGSVRVVCAFDRPEGLAGPAIAARNCM